MFHMCFIWIQITYEKDNVLVYLFQIFLEKFNSKLNLLL